MEKGLNKKTIEKMNIENKQNRKIDEYLGEVLLNSHYGYEISDEIEIIKRIRAYREKIFELKSQIKDINKLYDELQMPKFFYDGEYKQVTPNIYQSRYIKLSYDPFEADAVRILFFIYRYYENLIAYFEQKLLEEKEEIQNESYSNKEEILELQ